MPGVFTEDSEEGVWMLSSSQYVCPAAMLARSILDVWLSGDRCRLRLELERVTSMPLPSDVDDQSDRLELLKSIAGRMAESTDLFAPRRASPRIGAWLDLLDHLSGEDPALR